MTSLRGDALASEADGSGEWWTLQEGAPRTTERGHSHMEGQRGFLHSLAMGCGANQQGSVPHL